MRGLLTAGFLAVAGIALANDHNNIEAGRPLSFDDAYSVAFGERAIEFGLGIDTWRRSSPDYRLKSEFKYGFAKNQDIGVAIEPVYSTSDRRGDFGNVEIGYFHGLRREIGNAPALAYRVDVGLPTGRESQGIDLRFRGVLTKALGQYDKLHLNLDLNMATDPHPGERRHSVGAVLGYSTPLGYPRKFDQTLVAEFGLQQSRQDGQGYVGSVGIGLRKQTDPRSVFDLGISSEVFSTKGGDLRPLRLTAGFSMGF